MVWPDIWAHGFLLSFCVLAIQYLVSISRHRWAWVTLGQLTWHCFAPWLLASLFLPSMMSTSYVLYLGVSSGCHRGKPSQKSSIKYDEMLVFYGSLSTPRSCPALLSMVFRGLLNCSDWLGPMGGNKRVITSIGPRQKMCVCIRVANVVQAVCLFWCSRPFWQSLFWFCGNLAFPDFPLPVLKG